MFFSRHFVLLTTLSASAKVCPHSLLLRFSAAQTLLAAHKTSQRSSQRNVISVQMEAENDRTSHWQDRWSTGQIGFHKPAVHKMLEKHFDKLTTDGKLEKIFIPLCGKSLDMKWLYDQGIQVIGIDIIPKALTEFFSDHNMEYTETPVPALGPDCSLFQSKDGKIKLYSGDIFLYNESFDGKFGAIWDRASIVALNRPDVPSYAEFSKKLLNPGGKILLEGMEYDPEELKGTGANNPPPFPMYEDEIRSLFEPDCSVTYIDAEDRTLASIAVKTGIYLITKK